MRASHALCHRPENLGNHGQGLRFPLEKGVSLSLATGGGEGDPITRRGSKPEAPNPGRDPRELIPKPASHPRCQRLRAALEVQSPAVSVRGLLRTSASAQNTCSCPKSHTPSSGLVPQPQQLVQHCSHLLPEQLPQGWIPGNGSVLSH